LYNKKSTARASSKKKGPVRLIFQVSDTKSNKKKKNKK
jgi:lipopolysaccharide export system protein LptA